VTDITTSSGIGFLHHDNLFNDFGAQRLLPQKYSQMGPFLSVADINGDVLKISLPVTVLIFLVV
jgi:hypothetical protein